MAADQIETLKGLLERVKAAEGPDLSLDVQIVARLQQPGEWSEADIEYACADPRRTCDPPRYTASLDATLSLVSGVLPGWRWVAHSPRSGMAYGASLSDPRRGGRIVPSEHEVSAQLAILSALLSAKLSLLTQEEGNG